MVISPLLILTQISLLSASIIGEGASAYATIQNINHWQGLTAAAIVVAALVAMGKMKPTPFKVVAVARAGVFWLAIMMGGGFFFAEYWPAFSFAGKQLVGIVKAMVA